MGHKHKKHHRDHDSDDDGHKKKKHHRDRDSDEEEHRHKSKKVEEVAQMLGYTNDLNPFQDSNLLQPFVWGKKAEKDKYEGKKKESSDDKRLQLMAEIDKARKRRADRENELEELERLRDEEMRLREAASYGDWQKKEEDFHVEQVRQRSKLRLMNRREKPIDTIARNILIIEAVKDITNLSKQDRNILELDVDVGNPVNFVSELDLDELKQLLEDVDGYIQLEMNNKKTYLKFWRSMELIIKRSINLKKGNIDLHSAVTREVNDLFAAKSEQELELLVEDIERKARDESRDADYWKTLSGEAQFQQAKRYVQQVHDDLVSNQLQEYRRMRELREQQSSQVNGSSSSNNASSGYNRGSGGGGGGVEGELEDDENNMAASDEVQLSQQNYAWQDKYRPRKPRYFNRVKTGYDWNKYNQTHYDVDNPPPLTVQGYKFTIFYPDLVDVTKTPRYFLEPCGDTKEFVIIRFHAGPPYEDVAFKIVNKEWDTHRKSGYLSVFERGVLQLNFNFKRIFYRR